ncbi:hypothetical protein POSPLADRAFT_1073817 [Postia placenta MAD-698-R-SB12]|uniref:SUZ domain-containing protein n=1 Tax=Postia placenta MAD-698-R-SB12 TaxID=670580 RepID=A0A1X6N6J8_9APHY|nr:hypothetical protein POSPLADRAFT_1073817 [Postia placenta MAD-698-R-SB12]OSX64235.1 hypothetical protein POSPLADRAFT_1073817 [Postia placenta MAD-698-R-SB12]
MATATMSPTPAAISSSSAPEIHPGHTLAASTIGPSPSLDGLLVTSPRDTSPDLSGSTSSPSSGDLAPGSNDNPPEPDAQITEALRSKDRLYVLKLGELMESLINERRVKIDLTPATSYQRMLVHRCSAYYKLSPESDAATKSITVFYRSESRIPARRISELVPAEESAQPAFKIMRRGAQDGSKSRQNSQTGSVIGEDADLSDDESGSVGGRSAATGSSTKRHLTLEEREAAYNEARSRIFMGFEEKEKEKEKDMSANSSTFSLVSGSGSTSGTRGSSIGDLDDSASSAATESEWSGPVTRDRRDSRRGGSNASSNRSSMRSSGASFNNGSGSSRNSRATSPSFTYASLYEPPPPMDCQPYGSQAPQPNYMAHYYYAYGATPGPIPPATYGYPYYMPYGYTPPPPADPAAPVPPESMYPATHTTPPQGSYMSSYAWSQSPPNQSMPPPSSTQPRSPGGTGVSLPHHPSQSASSQPQNIVQAQYYTYPPQFNPYSMQGYHPPPPVYPNPYGPPTGPLPGQQIYVPDPTHASGYMNGNGADSSNHSRASSRSSNGHRRGAPRARGSWSYGPGAGNNGYSFNMNGHGAGGAEVGPRLSSTFRRTSSGSGSAGARTPGDEASSTASSTSSSSRQTYTSTSSKHPLPPRPDWAVGLKAQPGLHPPRHHDHNNTNSRTLSPARPGGPLHLTTPHQSQPVLQSTDFPPLSSSSAPEKRLPVVSGAWQNPSSTRSIIMPGPQGNPNGSVLVHYPNIPQTTAANSSVTARLDDSDASFERPPPKGNTELFNPKGNSRTAVSINGNGTSTAGQAELKDGPKDKVRPTGDAADSGIPEKLGSMSLEEPPAAVGFMQRPSSVVPPSTDALDSAVQVDSL